MARQRSPNYPAFSLPTAIDRIKVIHGAEGRNPASREAIAKHIGFGGLNGASATALSALAKYGLLEAVGDGEARVSDLSLKILFPHDLAEKQDALTEAAFRPALFAKLRDKWPDRPPSDESLRSYLVREGFAQGVVSDVIQYYRETSEIVTPREIVHDSSSDHEHKEAKSTMPNTPIMEVTQPAPIMPPSGKPFTIGFDGTILTGTIAIKSVRDIDRLMKVLKAQKAAFEAMEDHDDGPFDNDDEDQSNDNQ
ncbi:hypothetical protein [Rhizobium bangladeshense]|uniref:hypothetical protein n=1 Tax=Rhizobium bangladeshense TaxID=1138189 RepID=UPI0007E5564D|nr:hypothetical protein [Rhizobium bangladeshense]